ncbi:MAG: isocitrate/isopropylmalate dehydrogenase family protein [Methanothrix sp.]|jgi:methanogen homoisocitrate dehydrogenase|uniref:3-isopropylmalate dehydrogenase n=1 Tax=Methanothrix thermoacetophila (strain DSM 6194 / JCM 14653 / NBRC 101360 / PT) TaxID=349307 RepID=A0B7H0_METTP|nr:MULTISPECIES: isocitrate/isopropylmalate dehydrogenase family protein [Methanothrix]ABK14644.1 3-isopropylmalate dehydrogenase [Methanothrix thermoacetophila PT]MBC7079086.1 isocitrate/isopropylmalate dehydrogenase family protein [Methanothrix sp.]NPU87242.1 isocitrate/isopropylmalate dehydrogenase family protein [Methanothrix sp.]
MKKIALVPGDGIGPEVISSALRVLNAAGFDGELVEFDIGYGRWRRDGKAITDDDIERMKDCDCILFGAITTPPDPGYRSVLIRIRKELDLYANIRPLRSSRIDVIIVRENTEGLYSGLEMLGDEEARTVRVITRKGSQRIAEVACRIASERKHLTIIHKANVLKSDVLFLKTCREVAERYGIRYDDMLVDAAAYNMVIRPEMFDVMVTTNLFGDILSDEGAGIVGSLGLCASANLGDRWALFEPIHGSAPDIAGNGIANPVGAIRSAAMMLEWFGEMERAQSIHQAVDRTLSKGVKTPDLGGLCTTSEFTDAVIDEMRRAGAC